LDSVKVPVRPPSQVPVTVMRATVALVSTLVTLSTVVTSSMTVPRFTLWQPVPMTVKRDSTPWMPYQKRSGWWGSRLAGLVVLACFTLPMLPPRTACVPLPKRSEEEENTGMLAFLEASRILMASTRVPAMGLSRKTGLCASMHGSTCSRCTRPSLDSRKTTSTLSSSSWMLGTISTPRALTFSVYSGTRSVLEGMSLEPCAYAATRRTPMTSGFCGVVFSVLVKASTWEVSSPMMPARMFCALALRESSAKAPTVKSRERIMAEDYAARGAAFRQALATKPAAQGKPPLRSTKGLKQVRKSGGGRMGTTSSVYSHP